MCLRVLLGMHGYFWEHVGTFGHSQVLLGTRGYFLARKGTFGPARICLGTYGYFWACAGTFGHAGVLLGVRKPLYPAREFKLVPDCLLTIHFLQKM